MEEIKKNYIKQNKRKIPVIPLKTFFVIALIIVACIIEWKKNGSYLDEIIGIVSMAYLILINRNLKKRDYISFSFLIGAIIIGLISNVVSGLVTNYSYILIDIVTETKIIFTFYALKYFLNDREKQRVIDFLVIIAKVYFLSAFFFGILSQFANIGMTGEIRFGFIKTFHFFFTFNFQYTSVCTLLFGVLVYNTKMTDKQRNRYYVIALIAFALAGKSPAFIFATLFIVLFFYLKKHKRLNIGIIIVLAVFVIYLGQYQINAYLENENAARHLFYKYAFKTANHYFPVGSGFATYGSDQAAKHYSSLYYTYGFNNRWGLNPENPAYLNDAFWSTPIGQFGYVGTILYIVAFLRILFSSFNKNYSYSKKAFIFAAFTQFIVHGIGAAILSSSAGIIGFSTLALFTLSESDENEKYKLPKVRIHL